MTANHHSTQSLSIPPCATKKIPSAEREILAKQFMVLHAKWKKTQSDMAMQAMIKHFAPLVSVIANIEIARLPPSIEKDDLVAVGNFGLWRALQRSTACSTNPVHSYSSIGSLVRQRIKGAMLDYLREDGKANGYVRGGGAQAVVINLGALGTGNEAEATLLDGLTRQNSRDMTLAAVEARQKLFRLAAAFNTLPAHEARVLQLRDGKLTLDEVGKDIGVTTGRACQLEGSAFKRLAEAISGPDTSGPPARPLRKQSGAKMTNRTAAP